MKHLIDAVTFDRKYTTKFGDLFKFKISYYGENEILMYGFYSSKKESQDYFIPGKEAEFETTTRNTPMGEETVIKRAFTPRNTDYGRQVKQERARYAGFSASYVKDMIIAGKIVPEIDEITRQQNDDLIMTWRKRSLEIWHHLDKLDNPKTEEK